MSKQGACVRLATTTLINGSSAVIYLNSQEVGKGQEFGLFIKLSSAGTPNVQFDVEQSYVPLTTATEGSANSNYVTPDGVAAIGTANDKNAHIYGIPLRPMPYFRLKCSGLSGNPSDTTLEAILFVQQSGN